MIDISRNDLDQLILAYSQKLVGDNLLCIFVSGSRYRGDHHYDSDLDILILCKNIPNAWKVSEMVNGIRYDVKVFDSETLLYELHNDRNNTMQSMNTYLVSNSYILPSNQPDGLFLQNTAKKFWQEGPNKDTTQNYIALYRRDIAISCQVLSRSTGTRDIFIPHIIQSYKNCSDLMMLFHDRYLFNGKWIHIILSEIDAAYECRLRVAVEEFFAKNDTHLFIKVLEETLEKTGGLADLNDSYRSDLPANRRFKLTLPPISRSGFQG